MTDKEIKNKLIEIVLAMVERSEDTDDLFTGLNMMMKMDDYTVNISLNYEIVPKEEVE